MLGVQPHPCIVPYGAVNSDDLEIGAKEDDDVGVQAIYDMSEVNSLHVRGWAIEGATLQILSLSLRASQPVLKKLE